MSRKKERGGRGMLSILLLAADLVLLAVIVKAYRAEKDELSFASAPVIPAAESIAAPESVPAEPMTVIPPQEEAPQQVSVPEPPAPEIPVSEPAVPETPVSEPPAPEPVSYDTYERPTDADFADWYARDVMWYGAPADVERITDFSALLGGWKGLIYYDPENAYQNEAVELVNFRLDGGAESAVLTVDWYNIYWVQDGRGYSEEQQEDSTFAGTWQLGELYVVGPGNIRFTDFYTRDGKQYACGLMTCPDGIPARVAMVRP